MTGFTTPSDGNFTTSGGYLEEQITIKRYVSAIDVLNLFQVTPKLTRKARFMRRYRKLWMNFKYVRRNKDGQRRPHQNN